MSAVPERSAVTATKGVLKRAAAAVPASPGTVVLIYHRVGVPAGEMGVASDVFAAQLDELVDGGALASLDAAVGALEAKADHANDRPQVVVTFDDGTADIVDHALPRLVERRVPMTLYVATRFVAHHLDAGRGAVQRVGR